MEPLTVSDDERRLVFLFRTLASERERDKFLRALAMRLLKRYFGDFDASCFMPFAAGIQPLGSIHDESSIAYILDRGIEATGDPLESLLGSSYWDESWVIPHFAAAADYVATEQGSCFDYGEKFARKYIKAWRWEIVYAIASQKRKIANNKKPETDT